MVKSGGIGFDAMIFHYLPFATAAVLCARHAVTCPRVLHRVRRQSEPGNFRHVRMTISVLPLAKHQNLLAVDDAGFWRKKFLRVAYKFAPVAQEQPKM